jgi:hypothetical protein
MDATATRFYFQHTNGIHMSDGNLGIITEDVSSVMLHT